MWYTRGIMRCCYMNRDIWSFQKIKIFSIDVNKSLVILQVCRLLNSFQCDRLEGVAVNIIEIATHSNICTLVWEINQLLFILVKETFPVILPGLVALQIFFSSYPEVIMLYSAWAEFFNGFSLNPVPRKLCLPANSPQPE